MSAIKPLDIVIFGLSITSAWGNGHATTYRALVRALAARGHRVRFFERDVPWYARNRDLPHPEYCDLEIYSSLEQLEALLPDPLRADLVIFGSYVPQGAQLATKLLPRVEGLSAFYDIDTPVTVARLEGNDCEYLSPSLVPRFDLYLSFAGGRVLERLRDQWGAQRARPLYCSVDPGDYYPVADAVKSYDLGYLGTYSADRQPTLEQLLLQPARAWPAGRFYIAGAQYPADIRWPANVRHAEHLPPVAHRDFYNSLRLTLNVTRADMVANGYSPSVRLFEAAACGVPIVTDEWAGLRELFVPGREILVARSSADVLTYLRDCDDDTLHSIACRARARVLAKHTAAHRARELEGHVRDALGRPSEYRSRPSAEPEQHPRAAAATHSI
jgi:spore maturation protein CgeB